MQRITQRQIVPLDELEGYPKPDECLPCAQAYRCSGAVVALIETNHPFYLGGIRVVGLCGSHAEVIDLDRIGFTY
jgi:hypothetical protein